MEEISKNTGIDSLIQMGKEEAIEKRGNAKFLIINPLGSMVLKEILALEDTMELPKFYKGLEVVYTIDQYEEVARVY
ncbi:MAG: hypothetical protein GOVbin1709_36 [Prokaryotic dsDNA virus sp.]|nr:MAG: hypothetical protein GOVbin1709_36 [Prokaryotic dsDNA virus sp.]|tara:strand:+ start:1267 stop:1497 length:231 start_codon:yes stop_codon:yes gene_type:complete